MVAELGGDTRDQISDLWDLLATTVGLSRSHSREPPHVTFAIAHGDRQDDAEQLMAMIELTASTVAPFPVKGAGYGVFIGDRNDSPVLHIALTRTPRLAALHELVLRDVARAGFDHDGQCLPEHWRPHVNLADRGLTPDATGRAVALLMDHKPRRWTFTIANLAVVTDAWRATVPLAGGMTVTPHDLSIG